MPTFPSGEWSESVQEAVNNDSQFKRIGEYFDATILFEFGKERYLFKVADGEVKSVQIYPEFASWDFAIRAPINTWEMFLSSSPPPFYNDLRSVWLQHDLSIEGDLKVAIQHWRPLKHLIAVFREVAE